ncbi:IS3 family transposase [Roseovarius sp. A46]|uniref:transposase n=1 Tax=Roseovarius sp. A46 TaxID=2109331 RepID=UPI001010FE44|nr:transposase [Roseovarius sp. A46]RXV59444.1 IS3 family transposase [Roseovarius sp. A46]
MEDKNSSTSGATEATTLAARAHNAGDGGVVAGGAKRFSAKRKLAAVQRLMRGESLDAVSREENVPVHRLTEWRDKVLMGAESALKERERDARDEEIARLQAKVGEITMDNELLYAKIDKLEGGRSLARRRSKK